jgi:hypothetical protein
MAYTSTASDWECGACAFSNKGGKYCTMCTAPHPRCKAVLAAFVVDVAVPAEVIAAPAAVAKAILFAPTSRAVHVAATGAVVATSTTVAKAILSAPMPLAVVGAPASVAKKAKVLKESAPVMADVAEPTEVVAMPAPVAKAKAPDETVPGPFHLPGVVIEIIGMEMGDQGRSSEECVNSCDVVMANKVVVHLRKVQMMVEGLQETAIAVYWVTGGINCFRVGFLPCHMVRHATHYDGAVVQVTCVFSADPTCCGSAECRMFHKNKGCCLMAIIVWRSE